MDIQRAYQLLQLENIHSVSLTEVKKQYYRLALENHPDKNGNTEESTLRFQEINEAYEVIKREIEEIEEIDKEESSATSTATSNTTSFSYLLRSWLKEWFQNTIDETKMTLLIDLLISLLQKGTNKVTMNMDPSSAQVMLPILIHMSSVFHINEDIIQKVRDIIKSDEKNMETIIIQPSLRDLFENKIFKYERKGEIYFVPLWHSEMVFSDKTYKEEFVVKCLPNLPNNMKIDENNNIHIVEKVVFSAMNLLEQRDINVSLEGYNWNIPTERLNCKREQIYTMKREGIAKINERNIYNIEERGDILFHIVFV
jgi:hypothetical protein